jgi:Family of unknown function (DUF6086)
MSYLFEHRDASIWEPSTEAAKLLLAATSHLEDRLGIESGLTEYMSDTVDVRFDQLRRFLTALRGWVNPENTSMAYLVKPVFVHLMSLLYCGDPSADEVGRGYPLDWVHEARELARTNMRWAGDPGLAGRVTGGTAT